MTLAMPPNGRVAREPFRTIGARFPLEVCDQIEADADRLGMSVSDWMRMSARLTLAAEISWQQAAEHATAEGHRPGR